MEDYEYEIEELERKISELENKFDTVVEDCYELKDENEKLKRKITELITEKENLLSENRYLNLAIMKMLEDYSQKTYCG